MKIKAAVKASVFKYILFAVGFILLHRSESLYYRQWIIKHSKRIVQAVETAYLQLLSHGFSKTGTQAEYAVCMV